jgi:hypothetical protein
MRFFKRTRSIRHGYERSFYGIELRAAGNEGRNKEPYKIPFVKHGLSPADLINNVFFF